MVTRPTIADLANAAGVSVATVDRVLNRRLKVSDDTLARLHELAVPAAPTTQAPPETGTVTTEGDVKEICMLYLREAEPQFWRICQVWC